MFMFVMMAFGVFAMGVAAAIAMAIAYLIAFIIAHLAGGSLRDYHGDMQMQENIKEMRQTIFNLTLFVICIIIGIVSGVHYKSFEAGFCWFVGSSFFVVQAIGEWENM